MSQLQEEAGPRAPVPYCPYVGLREFTEESADFFFGRDAERKRIIGNLRAARLTLLYAESGVGKSSLLRAGVVPRIRELGERTRAENRAARYVPVVFSSWGTDPKAALIDAIADAIAPFVSAGPALPRGGLDEAIAAAATKTGATLLIILDQFEEFFLYRSRAGHDETFADQLARCINDPDLRANFLISIREDAYAGIGELLKARVPNVYRNYLHLEYLHRDAARDAILRPIDRFNELRIGERPIVIEPELVAAVLDQVGRGQVVARESEQAPESRPDRDDAMRVETTYLQLVMSRLWDEEMAAGSRLLRLETLERLGGAQTIIGTHLDQSISQLSPEQQDAAATVFRFLVTSTGTKIALSVEDLAELSGLPEGELGPMTRRLAAADTHILRPVVTRDGAERPRFEIFHDALARPVLDWRTRYARRKRDAEVAAQLEHERTQREEAQREALEAGAREARERKRKRLAVAGLILSIVALLAVAVAFALVQKGTADEKKAFAQSVESARRISALNGSPTFGPDAFAVASVEVSGVSNSFAARDLTLGALQTNVGMPAIAAGHNRDGLTVAFVSNSELASGSADGTIRLWNARGRQLGDALEFSESATVNSLATHAGRGLLAAAGSDGILDLWKVKDPRAPTRKSSVQVSDQGENAVAFSPDGKLVAVGGDDAQVSLRDVSDPELQQPVGSVAGLGTIRSLSFNADATLLAVASDDGVATLAGPDFAHAQPAWLDTRSATSVAFSPDGALAYGVSSDTEPGIVLDVAGQRSVLTTTGIVNSLTFDPSGSVLVSGGADANVTTWDVETGRPFGPPRNEESTYAVNGIAVTPDGGMIAEAGDSGYVKLWPLVVKGSLATTVGSLGPMDLEGRDDEWDQPYIYGLDVGPDGQIAAAAADAGTVIWKYGAAGKRSAPEPLTRLPLEPGEETQSVAYHKNVLAVVNSRSSGDPPDTFEDAIVTLWDTGPSCRTMPRTACPLGSSPPVHTAIDSIAFDRNGKLLATGYQSGGFELWDVSHPKAGIRRLARRKRGGYVNKVVFSPTASVLAVGGSDGRIRLWDVEKARRPRLLDAPSAHQGQSVTALAFDPDGKVLASGGFQETALWTIDLGSEEPLKKRPGGTFRQTNTIQVLAFSPGGSVIAAGDGDGSICLYGVQSREAIGADSCLTEHYGSSANLGGISALAFLHDGTLLSAGQSNPVVAWNSVLWDERTDEQASERVSGAACRLAARNLTKDEWDQAFGGTELAQQRHRTCDNYPLP